MHSLSSFALHKHQKKMNAKKSGMTLCRTDFHFCMSNRFIMELQKKKMACFVQVHCVSKVHVHVLTLAVCRLCLCMRTHSNVSIFLFLCVEITWCACSLQKCNRTMAAKCNQREMLKCHVICNFSLIIWMHYIKYQDKGIIC